MKNTLKVRIDLGSSIDTVKYLRRFTLLESLSCSSVYALQFMNMPYGALDDILNTDKNFRMRISIMVEDPNATPRYTTYAGTWKSLRLGDYDIDHRGNSFDIILKGMDLGYSLHEYTSQGMYKEKRISDIVHILARAHRLTSNIVDTQGTFTIPQGVMDDATFISEVLMPKAHTGYRGDFLFYIQDGRRLVFAPPDFGQTPVATLVFNHPDAKRNTVNALKISYRRSLMAPNMSLVNTTRGWDPYQKQLLEEVVSEDTVNFTRLARSTPTTNKNPARVHRTIAPYDLLKPDQKELHLSAATRWSRHCHEMYLVPIVLKPGRPDIRPGDIVNVDASGPSGTKHFSSGRYWVYSAKNILDPDGYRTELSLMRRTLLI